jgi:hypothetical protein
MFTMENSPTSDSIHIVASQWTLLFCFLSLTISVIRSLFLK